MGDVLEGTVHENLAPREVTDEHILDRTVCDGAPIEVLILIGNLADSRPARGLELRDLVDFRPPRGLELGAVREDFAMRDNLEGEREVIDEAFEGLTIGGDNLALVNLEDLRPESHA